MTAVVPTVFICSDHGQRTVLEPAAEALSAAGIRVLRDPVTVPAGGSRRYTAEEAAALLGQADIGVFTIRHACTRELLAASPRLRAVCYPTTGVESLDLQAANDLGILVAHGATPGNVIGIAEATLMLMLALLYDLHGSERRMKEQRPKPAYPVARALHGKTVGFVGFGRIAQALAQRLSPFGVRMLAYTRRSSPSLPHGVNAAGLEAVMRESDVVCVLVTINPESRGMLGERELGWMKPSAFLVNTGRGEAMDEAALHRALKQRRIAGAALDTFAQEPLAADSPLRELDNVILTPHMVGQTREAADEFAPALVENVKLMLRGELPTYCKNPEIAPQWRQRFGAPA